ncbi:MAG: ABC transporter ATP-binding protein/permease [Betaproteobacteria bacterium]|nr:ABC transporter ATP-binding protein/permease [Betaproteobacteria bacterium]
MFGRIGEVVTNRVTRSESAAGDAASRGAITRLFIIARPYWGHMFGCLLLSLVAVPLSLLAPLPLKIAVDNVIGTEPIPPWLDVLLPEALQQSTAALLAFAAVLMVSVMLLLHLQSLVSWLLQTYTGQRLLLEFRAQLFSHVQRLSLAYHDAVGSTDSTYRIQYDATAIQNVTVTGLIPLVTAALTLIGMIWVTARMDWQLAVLALGVCPILYGLTVIFANQLKQRWKEVKSVDSSAMSVVQEALSSLRVIKAFGAETREQERFLRRSGDALRKQVNAALVQGGYDLLVGLTLAIGSAAGLYLGVHHVRSGVLTLGELLMVMAYLAMLYGPLRTLSKKIVDLQSGVASAERAFAVLDQTVEVAERPRARPLARATGEIVFRDVSFGYGGGPEVLRNVSFRVPPGSSVGIQGVTGAGKTTLMSLLTRFYDPSSGEILLDGVDIRDYRLADLRNQFAIVLQEPVLFSTTITENIAYGRPGARAGEIEQAARLASAHDFIAALPDGYQTLVGERGMSLSGGERQRIALARAFLRDTPILILDEPTSSVDVGTEGGIVEVLQRLMRDRTTFIIAHRMSTLESCDVRLTVRDGTVAPDTGNREERRAALA